MSHDNLRPTHSEGIVIGSILVRGVEGLDDAKRFLRDVDFSTHLSQLLFRTAERLACDSRSINPATVFAALIDSREAAELGEAGGALLQQLHDVAGVGADIDYHAQIVSDAAKRRALAALGARVAGNAEKMSGVDLAAEVQRELAEIEGAQAEEPRLLSDVLAELIEDMNRRTQPGYTADIIKTGLRSLDWKSGGGFAPGELVILAARPGRGKTALLLQLARAFAECHERPLLFSLEMRAKENAARTISAEAPTEMHVFRGAYKPSIEQAQAIMAAYHRLCSGPPAWIDDKPDCTAARIATMTRRFVRKHGTRVVLVDYLQLLRPTNPKEPRHQQVGQATRELKLLARNLGIVVVCAAQLNREVEGRPDPTPRLSDLRDSGEIEQHADFVFFLHGASETQHNPEENIELICGKGRSVSAGYKLPLSWDKPRMTFTETIPQ